MHGGDRGESDERLEPGDGERVADGGAVEPEAVRDISSDTQLHDVDGDCQRDRRRVGAHRHPHQRHPRQWLLRFYQCRPVRGPARFPAGVSLAQPYAHQLPEPRLLAHRRRQHNTSRHPGGAAAAVHRVLLRGDRADGGSAPAAGGRHDAEARWLLLRRRRRRRWPLEAAARGPDSAERDGPCARRRLHSARGWAAHCARPLRAHA